MLNELLIRRGLNQYSPMNDWRSLKLFCYTKDKNEVLSMEAVFTVLEAQFYMLEENIGSSLADPKEDHPHSFWFNIID